MDTVIKNINLHGKQNEVSISDIEDWINDTANKLNLMLNLNAATAITAGETERSKQVKEEPQEIITPNDYIVESGSTREGLCENSITSESICYYRKWKSGIMELWGRRMCENVNVDVPIASGYVSRVMYGDIQSNKIAVWGNWPIQFTERPSVTYRVASADTTDFSGDYEIIHSMHGYKDTTLINTATTAPSFAIRRETTKLYGHPVVTFHAIGRWE